jgi:PAS domain S-box-containing protein
MGLPVSDPTPAWLLGASAVGVLTAALVLLLLFRQSSLTRALLHERDSSLRVLSEVARRTTNPVVITNAAGEIEWANKAFEELSGWTLNEAAGHRPGQLVHGPGTDPETKRYMHDAVRDGRGFTRDVVNYHRSGKPYVVSLDVQPIRNRDGGVEHFISVAVDVTSRYTTEQRLRKTLHTAQVASQEKFSFLATMSHQLRTPLNAVVGGSSLLDRGELTADQRRHLTLVTDGAERSLLLVDNLLTLSALDVGGRPLSYSPTDLHRLLNSLRETCTTLQDGVDLEIVVTESVPTRVSVDGPRLRQLLVNLLNHASVSLGRGTVRLTASPGERNGMVVLEVFAPTGHEDPSQLADLLDPSGANTPLRTDRESSTALGLRTSSVIARHLGGRVETEVDPDRGTTIRTVLPLPDLSAHPAWPETTESDVPDLSEVSILVVDDDAVSRAVLRELLHQMGNDPGEATDGIDALERLADTRYDILLIDVDMPRMDGVELISVLRSGRTGYSDCTAIAVTANALPEDRMRLLSSGMDGYLSKPVRLRDLREELARNFRRATAMSQQEIPAQAPVGPGTVPDPGQAVPVPVDSIPVLDLEELSEALGLSPRDGLLDVVDLFLEDGHRRVDILSRQQAEQDLSGMRATAHALKGASANVHAERVRHYATQVEHIAGAGGLPSVQVIEQLAVELATLNEWVRDLEAGSASPKTSS